jgi:imidazole glycerol phosphate synthase glutamine amidotransferase subunit
MAVTLVDSPFANLRNIERALRAAGAEVLVTADAATIARATKIVLPGVGSFAAAMQWLRERSLDIALRDAATRGVPLLGICVGHQLLFESSTEGDGAEGLGLLRGSVTRFDDADRAVPQIGWNRIRAMRPSFVGGDADVYFVNSYRVAGSDDAVAMASYGGEFVAAVQRENVCGVQFHPEKSSDAGLRMLRSFV